ncbi:MAG: alpha/beta hydrolase [Acetobacteraceae bacterium]|nr:alpha/beta hydrolase [Acetobacteraceae bacterium]
MPQTEDAVFYQLYFQAPGSAETDLERDVRRSLRGIIYGNSGDFPLRLPKDAVGMVPRAGGLGALMAAGQFAQNLPPWLAEADIDFYAAEFARTGFRGGLNWYRNIDRNWELLAPFAGAKVTVPALYIAGDRDLVMAFRGMDQLIPNLAQFVPMLRGTVILPGCGHWTQQERAAEVNAAIIEFLHRL